MMDRSISSLITKAMREERVVCILSARAAKLLHLAEGVIVMHPTPDSSIPASSLFIKMHHQVWWLTFVVHFNRLKVAKGRLCLPQLEYLFCQVQCCILVTLGHSSSSPLHIPLWLHIWEPHSLHQPSSATAPTAPILWPAFEPWCLDRKSRKDL